jgi:hypothetical protein
MAATGAEAGTAQIQICGGDGRHRNRRRRSGSAALAACSRQTRSGSAALAACSSCGVQQAATAEVQQGAEPRRSRQGGRRLRQGAVRRSRQQVEDAAGSRRTVDEVRTAQELRSAARETEGKP